MEDLQVTPERQDLETLQKDFFTRLRDQGKSDNTLKNYRTDIQCFNRYLIEMMKQTKLSLDNIDLPQILEYGKYLQEKYQSDNSRRRRVQALRIFFDFLVERGIYSSNIVKKIPTSPKFLDIPKPTPFSDVKTLWMYLIDQEKSTTGLQQLVSRRNQLIFLLIYGSGLKVSDISGLTRKNVVFGSSPRVIIQPKKRDPYSIPLPKVFENVYRKYYKQLKTIMEQQNHNFAHLLFNANPYRILAGGISSRGLEILFEELRTKLMLHLTPKSLRQACIFKWFHDGAPESLIKEWMGVAPSYSFKSYRDCASENIYNDLFLNEMYREFTIH